MSDHNCILIDVEGVRGKFKEKIKKEERVVHGESQLRDVQIRIGKGGLYDQSRKLGENPG